MSATLTIHNIQKPYISHSKPLSYCCALYGDQKASLASVVHYWRCLGLDIWSCDNSNNSQASITAPPDHVSKCVSSSYFEPIQQQSYALPIDQPSTSHHIKVCNSPFRICSLLLPYHYHFCRFHFSTFFFRSVSFPKAWTLVVPVLLFVVFLLCRACRVDLVLTVPS